MTLLRGNRVLLSAFRRGEAAALESVYQHYIAPIESLVANGWFDSKSKTRTYGIIDVDIQMDLVQEVFMRAFAERARLAYDGVRPYKLFLFSIARNVIIDYVRKVPRDALSHAYLDLCDDLETVDKDILLKKVVADSTISEANLDWQRCLQATESYIGTLDVQKKTFVDLRFRQELSLLETARRLGVTRGKARFLEKDLGRSLKKHLQKLNLRINFG